MNFGEKKRVLVPNTIIKKNCPDYRGNGAGRRQWRRQAEKS